MKSSHLFFLIIFFFIITLCVQSKRREKQSVAKPPFLQPDTIHQATSEFELNLILNENRNLPVFYVQYSKDFVREMVETMLQGAFKKQSGIAFALLVDCRKFEYNLNKTLGICHRFDPEKAKEQQKADLQIDQDKRTDAFFKFDFMAPNPSRIRQKGHQLSKNHDVQNLRQMNNLFNDDFLAKVLRNEIADFVTYIEDTYDMDEFLEKKNDFRTGKKAKLLFFDQNLQAPLFLKKLAARLDGKIKVGVTDNFKLAKKFDAYIDSVMLMEYNFVTGDYDTTKITFEEGNEIKSILSHPTLIRYSKLKKYRDIILDFQHKEVPVYNMSTLSQINQLITHGRVILLQVSSEANSFSCKPLQQLLAKYDVLLNYACFSLAEVSLLQKAGLKINDKANIYVIDQDFKSAKSVTYDQNVNILEYLPQTPPRQKISAQSEAEMCLKTALTSKRDPVIYWYNQKDNKNAIRLLQYFNSIPQVTSLIHFCQIYLPQKDLIKRYQLRQNSLFSMINPNAQTGQMHKLQFKQALDFVSIKMFLRELAINQMMKVYQQKLSSNNLTEIKSAEDLTRECFNKDCIVALMATTKFRYESENQIMKELKLELSEAGFNFVWIDGICHWDIAKQLKLLDKTQREIDRSYIFYYKEKTNEFALMTSIQENKYWVKKDAKKWIRNVKQSGTIKKLKFGIDIEDKKCDKKTQQKKPAVQAKQAGSRPNRRRRANDVKQGEL